MIKDIKKHKYKIGNYHNKSREACIFDLDFTAAHLFYRFTKKSALWRSLEFNNVFHKSQIGKM